MKKILLFCLSFLLLTGIANAKTYTVSKDTSQLEVKKGDKIIVELSENPSTGYIWKLTATPETILIEQSKKFINANTKMAGVPGLLKYTYKAVATGDAKITGIYGRPWEKNSNSKSNYELSVIVK